MSDLNHSSSVDHPQFDDIYLTVNLEELLLSEEAV